MPLKKTLGLGVLECRWFKKGNTSVRPLFDTLADLHRKNPSAYVYEMFSDSKSFREVVLRVGGAKGINALYIAAHGDQTGLVGADGTSISRTIIANTLDGLSAEQSGALEGIYFGACGFGQQKNFNFVLKPLKSNKVNVSWIAGYEKAVNWIDSSVVDLFFWHSYLRSQGSALKRIKKVAKRIENFMPGANKKLGLQIYIPVPARKTGKASVRPLLGKPQ